MSALLRMGFVMCALWLSDHAHAHTSGSSFLSVRATGGNTVDMALDFDLRDLHQLLQLDQNQDGNLSWGEIRTAQRAIESLLLTKTRVTSGEHACAIAARRPLAIAEHGTGPYAQVSVSLQCQAISALHIDHSKWFAFDPGHRALLEYTNEKGERAQSILSQTAPRWRVQESFAMRMWRFLLEGGVHLITGYDHLAFLAVLLLALARRTQAAANSLPSIPLSSVSLSAMLRRALTVITAFTVAHSFTLALAATGYLSLPSKPVEIAIAVSVLIAALLNLWRGAGAHGWKLAFAFGLVHGLGFASALAELTSEQIDLFALAAFNLGIETAQLIIATVAVPLIWWLFRSASRERIGVPAVSILVAGVAAFWVVNRIVTT